MHTIPIQKIIIGDRFRKHIGDVKSLADSIKAVGLMHPIVVDKQNRLVAGLRRIEAFKALGRTEIPATIIDIEDLLQAEHDENVVRLNFTPSEAVAVWQAMESHQEKGKKIEGGSESEPRPKRIKRAAAVVGLGVDTLSKAKQVVDSGDTKLVEKMDNTGNVNAPYREVRRRQHAERLETLAAKSVPMPERRYDVIVIDPPWPMEKIERDCRPNQHRALDYPVMLLDKILALELPMAKDCHIWLWTTHRFLPDAFDALRTWGLKYICAFVWHKNGGFQPVGLPQFNCEFALYARKGSPQFASTKNLKVCFDAARGRHSEKPDEFYQMVKRIAAGRRLDMFSRKVHDGFDQWGQEA